MIYKDLTQNQFSEFKQDYAVYGTHKEDDRYKHEYLVVNDTPKGTINTMWHPMTGMLSVQEYGRDVSSMYYAIVYETNITIDYNDVVYLFGDPYEVVGIKHFNTHDRVDVKKKTG